MTNTTTMTVTTTTPTPTRKALISDVITLVSFDKNSAAWMFYHAWNDIDTVVEFKDDWKNGTGYLDGAMRDATMISGPHGSVVKFIDNFGRRAIAIKTRFGNVVIFQRYTDRDQVFAMNCPSRITAFLGFSGALDFSKLESLVGYTCSYANVGQRLEELFAPLTDMNARLDLGEKYDDIKADRAAKKAESQHVHHVG